MIEIREATKNQAAEIASLIMMAMTDDCCLYFCDEGYGLEDFRKMMTMLVKLENSQYSYKNTLVAMDGDKVVGISVSYDGGCLHMLRLAFIEAAKKYIGKDHSGIDDETQAGELYLDSLAVLPESRRQFNDRRKSVSFLQEQIRSRIAKHIDGGEDYFCIDSKPIEVCRIARGKRCKMGRSGDFTKAPDFGYCASQGKHFFGYKLHALCGLSGVIHSYDLSKASVHDINYLNDIKPLYHDCSIFGDKGYVGAEVQLDLFETANIRLECPYRENQKDWKPAFVPFAKARKRIETLFSQLTDQFLVIRNYAKETCGLFARIIGKVSALTALQYINYINNKPIGRIKYALI